MNQPKAGARNNFIKITGRKFNKKNILSFLWTILRAGILIGLGYLILYPFITKGINAFKSYADLIDPTVKFLPKEFTTEHIVRALKKMDYLNALLNTLLISLSVAVIQTFVAASVGYGFGKFKFRGNGLLFFFVILMLMVPPQTIIVPMFTKFRFFLGGINLIDTPFPVLIMAFTATGFKNGLYLFMMRQFFKNVPNELNEAASIDGCGVFKCFVRIMLPSAIPVMVTVFLLSFAWQWTDILYSNLFFKEMKLLSNVINIVSVGELQTLAGHLTSTAALCAVLPLALIYIFSQRAFVESIDRAGIVG